MRFTKPQSRDSNLSRVWRYSAAVTMVLLAATVIAYHFLDAPIELLLPVFVLIAVHVPLLAIVTRSAIRSNLPTFEPEDAMCPRCAYPLGNLPEIGQCPECGEIYSPDGPIRIENLLKCARCSYSIEGLPELGRCPECGEAYSPEVFRVAKSVRGARSSPTAPSDASTN